MSQFEDAYADPDFIAIVRYCHYQERCHSEVRRKLYELGVRTSKTDEIIATLIEKDILNEERFAIAYAGGKFRMKKWGKIKIKNELKQRQVSEYCIKKALDSLDNNEYYNALVIVGERYLKNLKKERHPQIRKEKLYRYLMQKGYESRLIGEVVNNLLSNAGD